MDKVKMTYKVNKGRNPQTGATILVPRVSRKPKMTLKQLVAFAKSAGFVRGQQKDLEGLINGFIEAMRDRAEAGYTVNVNDWFIITGDLAGQVGEDRQLTSANSYHVNIRTSKALKVGIENFSWTREDGVALMCIESLTSPNGTKGVVAVGKDIVANGRNIFFDAANGDTASIVFIDDATGEPTEVAVTPSELSETYLRFAAVPELEDARADSEVVLHVNAHDSSGALQPCTRTAKLLAASGPKSLKIVKATSTVTGNENEVKLFIDDTIIKVKGYDNTVTATYRLEMPSKVLELDMIDGNTLTLLEDGSLKLHLQANTTSEPDGTWKMGYPTYLVVRRGDGSEVTQRVTVV